MGISGRFLHIGPGAKNAGAAHSLPEWALGCQEVRLDIDARCEPDIVGSMTSLGEVGEFDFVYSCHALEHLYPHDVPVALAEHFRVLKTGGVAVTIVPDLEGIFPTDEPVYESYSGWITGLDMYYGKASFIEHSLHMAHHTGFTPKTLQAAYEAAGFTQVTVKKIQCHSIMCMGKKQTSP